ncbi:nucleoside 2-deoxyribosyltransferase [Candidatus Kaiserbacteria bacterium]|nr:nucleoside 2-deoxyribosyltransferase [Candidatus Kaiserbacteria bacterium]
MTITLCGSMKFNDRFLELQKELEALGHTVLMPTAVPGVDYWEEDGTKRQEAKKALRLVEKHLDKINESDAILVANYTKDDTENYIGANSFLEMGYAKYKGKKIFVLNPLPDQRYIRDELVSFEPIALNGDLSLIV